MLLHGLVAASRQRVVRWSETFAEGDDMPDRLRGWWEDLQSIANSARLLQCGRNRVNGCCSHRREKTEDGNAERRGTEHNAGTGSLLAAP